jgi:hypothetical protein
MVTDRQVRILRSKRMQGETLEAAAAAAGMSERSASTWQDGPMPSATTTSRTWRTRPDPFAAVWSTEIEPHLRSDEDGELLATTLMDELCRRHPEDFHPGQVRTLQRQIRRWRAMHGPQQEVFFPQDHQPGQLGAFDFTHCGELGLQGAFRGSSLARRTRLPSPAPSWTRSSIDRAAPSWPRSGSYSSRCRSIASPSTPRSTVAADRPLGQGPPSPRRRRDLAR